MVDSSSQNSHNSSGAIVIEGDSGQIKIPKRDLNWTSAGNHEHHYLPDFTDEWDKAIALKCAKPGCIHGIMHRKEGKEFMSWLEKHRAKS